METGELITLYRKQAGITIDELSARSGVPKGTLNKIIGNVTKAPTLDNMKAIARALGKTLADFDDLPIDTKTQNAPSDLSEEALKVAQDYSSLDQPGKYTVRVVIDAEHKRIYADKERRRLGPTELHSTRFIPYYYTPAAAGYTEPAEGQDFEYIEVGSEVSPRADCAIKISGKSMEPYIKDQSRVYIVREPIENGDVGIFFVNGDMICKQYYRDESGNVRLISLNRDYSNADRIIYARDDETILTYYGKVLLDVRPRIVL